MALIKNGALSDDPYIDICDVENPEFTGAVIVSLQQWLDNREQLSAHDAPLGIVLDSDQKPDLIADDLQHFSVVVLKFPNFRDGRAYSYARLLRDRYAYKGELRATGEVLLEQLHYMQRVGFNSFAVTSDDAARDWEIASNDLSVWYQPTSDKRATATSLRHKTGS